MRLAISNIAWTPDDDTAIRELLARQGVSGVEVAPTKICANPLDAPMETLTAYRAFWNEHGLLIPALQALLFGRPDLIIYGNEATREKTLEYLSRTMQLAAVLGARALVFGSPKNRQIGSMKPEEAREIGHSFFKRAGEAADRAGVCLCIEPNPPQYGCDFIRTIEEGVDLVRQVDSPGFRLHVDASAIILNGEDCASAIAMAADFMEHFHISEPELAPLGKYTDVHRRLAAALRDIGYKKWVSVEMRNAPEGNALSAVERAIEYAAEIYLA